MISDTALRLAVARGLLTETQLTGLQALADEVDGGDGSVRPQADAEMPRFVSGFADLFVALGLALFLWALGLFMDLGAGAPLSAAGLAAASWLLAEVFARRRHMALPSILLVVVFVLSSFLAAFEVAAAVLPGGPSMPLLARWLIADARTLPASLAAAFAILMTAMHVRRFGVPITVAIGAGLVWLLVGALLLTVVPDLSARGLDLVLAGCGVATFALAMRFDLSDPGRRTRRADVAFWLHMLAAPLIVHPLLSGAFGVPSDANRGAAVATLALFLLLGLVAVVIDRRALLVSGLIYAGLAVGALIRAGGLVPQDRLQPLVLLGLGAFILALSAGWQPLRSGLLHRLPVPLARRLRHPLEDRSP